MGITRQPKRQHRTLCISPTSIHMLILAPSINAANSYLSRRQTIRRSKSIHPKGNLCSSRLCIIPPFPRPQAFLNLLLNIKAPHHTSPPKSLPRQQETIHHTLRSNHWPHSHGPGSCANTCCSQLKDILGTFTTTSIK